MPEAQCTVWSFSVVMVSPAFDDDFGFTERVEDFTVQLLVAHSAVEVLAIRPFVTPPRFPEADLGVATANGGLVR